MLFTTTTTMWHSGLLFILLAIPVWGSELFYTPVGVVQRTTSGESIALNSGQYFNVDDLLDSKVLCNQSVYELRLNSQIVSEPAIKVSSNTRGTLECFSGIQSKSVRSYAFINILGDEEDIINTVSPSDDQPHLHLQTSQHQVVQGSDHRFRCQIDDQPIHYDDVIIDWYFNGNKITDGDKYNFLEDNQTLHIQSVLPNDAGSYGCFYRWQNSSHLLASGYSETYMMVKFSPILMIQPEHHQVSLGEDFEIQCQLRSFPSAEMKWTLSENPQYPLQGITQEDGDDRSDFVTTSILRMSNASEANTGTFRQVNLMR